MPGIEAQPPPATAVVNSDPIKATYEVYIKPQISSDRQIYVLQFPNSRKHYSHSNECEPLAFRLKPRAGMLQLDVPMNHQKNFDKEKAIEWGEAMRKNTIRGGLSYGLPGGFGLGANQVPGRGRPRADADDEVDPRKLVDDFDRAIERGQVLMKQTLGGQAVPKDITSPQYMVGAFRRGMLALLTTLVLRLANVFIGGLHLTPVDQMAQLRPQFHHVDAQTDQDRIVRARDQNATATRVQEARAVHMTVKSTIDGEDSTTESMNERLVAAQDEGWRKHKYVDEDTPEAWTSFAEHLFVGPHPEDGRIDRTNVPALESALDDIEYIDMLSAPKDLAKMSRSKGVRQTKQKVEEGDDSLGSVSQPTSGPDGEEEDAPC